MYNRYIPQSDGTFRRSSIEEKIPVHKPIPGNCSPPAPAAQEPCPAKPEPCIPARSVPPRHPSCVHGKKQHKNPTQSHSSVSSFLKQLLPKDFDTSDLMIVLLLLIMSGDCGEDQNTALLTLVLYLFL